MGMGSGVNALNGMTLDAAAAERADVSAAAAGDAAAFERLYRRHGGRIYSLAVRMLGEADAEDATQEAFIRAWRGLARFRGDAAFGTWLHRLAVNHFLGFRQSAARRRSRFTGEVEVADAPAPRPARPDIRMDMAAAVERLPEGARRIFVLHDVEGYTHEEIAGLLDLSPGTSKSQLHRARMALRAYLA
jgi:RNA polymerase sigma factor (sigma-70 family)